MKFISKSSNLLIVLRPGLAAQPITGTPAKPTVSVRFKDGIVDVQQEELVEMMLAHPGFGGDFISAESVPVDPYLASRQPSEPAHVLTEMKFGTPTARTVGGSNAVATLSPELQKAVTAMAAEMAKAMLPGLVESTLQSLVSAHGAAPKAAALTKAGKPKGRPGRKPKAVAAAPVVAETPSPVAHPLAQESVS